MGNVTALPKLSPALVCDLDGTRRRWQLFHEVIVGLVGAGLMSRTVLMEAEEAYRKWATREGPFDEWVAAQVHAYQSDGRLKGIRVKDVQTIAREIIHTKGAHEYVFARELANAATSIDLRRVLISGTMHEALVVYAEFRGDEIVLGTEHPHRKGRYTGGKPKEWVLDKAEAITFLAKKYRLNLGASVAIGDSTSDVGMFENVKWPLCFNPSAKLLSLARDKKWPCVFERKDVMIVLRANQFGHLVECDLESCLPPKLAEAMHERLQDRLWVGQPVSVVH